MNETPPPNPTPATGGGDAGQSHKPAVHMTNLSQELEGLRRAADGKPMSVGRMLDHLQDRGPAMFMIALMAPFLLLPTTFGLSAPMGFAVAILGFCQLIGRKPWLPAFILRKEFPYEALDKVIGRAAKMSAWVEKIARVRLRFFLWPGPINIIGLWLIVWGLLMALPGPNNVFAFMITLFCFGLLMRDGMLLLLGHVLTLITPVLVWVFWDQIAMIFEKTWGFIENGWHWAIGLF